MKFKSDLPAKLHGLAGQFRALGLLGAVAENAHARLRAPSISRE